MFPSVSQVTLWDGHLRPVLTTVGAGPTELEPGIYALDVGVGPTERHLIALQPGEENRLRYEIVFPSVAPLRGAEPDPETAALHRSLTTQVGPRDPEQAGLVVVTRTGSADAPPSSREGGVEVRAADQSVVLRTTAGGVLAEEIPALTPGPYTLRFDGAPASHEVPLWLPAGWRTTVFVSGTDPDNAVVASTVHLTRAGQAWDPGSDANASLEAAMSYLRRGYEPPARSVEVDLRLVEQNPYLGVALAHLLEPKEQPDYLDRLLGLLGELIPGHPDLVALLVRQNPATEAELPLTWPPLFARGTRAVARAAISREEVLGAGSAAEAAAVVMTGRGAWTAWPAGDVREPAVARQVQERIAVHLALVAAGHGVSRSMAADWFDAAQLAEATALPLGVVTAWWAQHRAQATWDDLVARIHGLLGVADPAAPVAGDPVSVEMIPDSGGTSGTLALHGDATLAAPDLFDVPIAVTGQDNDIRVHWFGLDQAIRVPLRAGRLEAGISTTLRYRDTVLAHVPRPVLAGVGADSGITERRRLDLPSGLGVSLRVQPDRRLHVQVTSSVPAHAGRYVAVLAQYSAAAGDETFFLIPLIPDEDTESAYGAVVLDRRAGVEIFTAFAPTDPADPAVLRTTLRYADNWTRRGLAAILDATGDSGQAPR
ncbi:hypothetical protein ADL15_27865 [Actinoplanes awajinensis subsp. mycoplanecinus]|uniref:Uncharacterized protein n=1 Tax=Actinoplanes awajinensis subsp. mycoplanecinus TaxID=135947 RepID=A0A117MPZ5_9ACTN|nr:hypothetical protein ADL15_27865 [Actinoplanes awajinensis subsp. mycoplanecinus]